MNMCPCKSNKPYSNCCEPYHTFAKLPENALVLMRSRFSAYALSLVDYIIQTTHPDNEQAKKNIALWKKEIEAFSKTTSFDDLKIIAFKEDKTEATVIFNAYLRQDNQNGSFQETSFFEKVKDHWLYKKALTLKRI